jgi:hypothetical protein
LEERDHGAFMPAVRVEIPLQTASSDTAASQHIELAATGARGSGDELDYELLEVQASWANSRVYESGTRMTVLLGVGGAHASFDAAGGSAAEFDVDTLSLPVGFASETPFASSIEFDLRAQWALLVGDDFGQSIQLEAGFGWRLAENVVASIGWRWWLFDSTAVSDPKYAAVDLDVDGPVLAISFRR